MHPCYIERHFEYRYGSACGFGPPGEWGERPRESVTVKPVWDKSGYLADPLSPPELESEIRSFLGLFCISLYCTPLLPATISSAGISFSPGWGFGVFNSLWD